MKVQAVLVKVYEPGRLQRAWQQVSKNAGAAGIDPMCSFTTSPSLSLGPDGLGYL
jgi:hypothetical protein